MFAGAGRVVGAQAVEGLEILEERRLVFGGVVAQGGFGFAHAPDDLVLHVGDVHDVADVVALELQVAPHQIGKNKGAEIADMGEVMHGGAAAIEADATGPGGRAGQIPGPSGTEY